MRHPFQRKSNAKETVQSPFQKVLVEFIQDYNKGGERMSGRKLSALLGKSSNHISQMLNDGFVPSGEALLEMAERLELSDEDSDALITAAMATKLDKRSRDHFWIAQTLRMLRHKDLELRIQRQFFEDSGQTKKYEDWRLSEAGQLAIQTAQEALEIPVSESGESTGRDHGQQGAAAAGSDDTEVAKSPKKSKASKRKASRTTKGSSTRSR